MTAAQIIKLTLTASILLLVLALGLRSTFAEATTLLREAFRPPNRLLRALVAMYLVVPIVAAVLAAFLDLPMPVKIALLAMAVSPVPPILPGKQLKMGGEASYVYGLLVAISLLAIVVVPLAIEVLDRFTRRDIRIGFADVAKPIGMAILLPLLVGLVVHQLVPTFAERVAPWLSRLGTLLLIGGLVPILVTMWPTIQSLLGDGTLLAIVTLLVAAIAAGHLLGGPDPQDRTALAISSAMRHPGIALTIAQLNYPEEKRVPAAILLFVLVGAILTTVYGKLRGRRA